MNSSYANDTKFALRLSHPTVFLNPAEAASRKVHEGSFVRLVNEEGKLDLVAKLSPDVPCGVALVHKGRWPKLDPNRANVNVLNPGEKTDLGESSCVHAIHADLQLI
jgi:anaerobic selenocysteine-containing dehydrogenase